MYDGSVSSQTSAAIVYYGFYAPGRNIFLASVWKDEGAKGQSYKAHFGINYISNGFSKLNFILNYINFDVIYAKQVL